MADDLEAEVVSEHHDRITEAEHEAEAAAEEAQRAAHEAESVMDQLARKSDIGHKHDEDYVRRDEIEPLIGNLVRRADEAARDAESAAREAADHAMPSSEPVEEPLVEGHPVDELPLPEPEAEPEYRYVRRHGRHERMKVG